MSFKKEKWHAIAKREGKYKGRKPLFEEPNDRLQHAFKLYKDGMSDKDVERNTGINRETFRRYRIKVGVKRTWEKNYKKERLFFGRFF